MAVSIGEVLVAEAVGIVESRPLVSVRVCRDRGEAKDEIDHTATHYCQPEVSHQV